MNFYNLSWFINMYIYMYLYMIWYDMIWYDMIWYDTIWDDMNTHISNNSPIYVPYMSRYSHKSAIICTHDPHFLPRAVRIVRRFYSLEEEEEMELIEEEKVWRPKHCLGIWPTNMGISPRKIGISPRKWGLTTKKMGMGSDHQQEWGVYGIYTDL